MDERRIYYEDLKHGDERIIAAELGYSASYVTRLLHEKLPATFFVRFVRALRRARPKLADRIVRWVWQQIHDDAEALERGLPWDHQAEAVRLVKEMHEGIEAVIRHAPIREMRRELICDIRHELDRWERQLDSEEQREASRR